jgi:hypothetical protein
MNRAGIALAVLATCVLADCRHAAPTPADALAAFGAAMERQDWAAAYGLMSASFRARVSRAELEQQVRRAFGDAGAAGRALREDTKRGGDRVAITLEADRRVKLVRENGAWRLEQLPVDPFAQDTPRAALRAFIAALEAGRYDVLVELAPARYRAQLTPEKLRSFWHDLGAERAAALLRDLRRALDERIVEEGDEAFVVYGRGRQVRFVREEGLWRIESPE